MKKINAVIFLLFLVVYFFSSVQNVYANNFNDNLREIRAEINRDNLEEAIKLIKKIEISNENQQEKIDLLFGDIYLKINQIDKAEEIMEKLDISLLKNQSLKKMSMGQKKRCLLARALVHNPKILLLDEPTTGLDLSSTYKYMDILSSLKKEGHNIILVTHNIHEINNVIERVIMLKKGKIVADGKKDKILTEENLTNTFDIEVGLKKLNGNLLPYRKTILQ